MAEAHRVVSSAAAMKNGLKMAISGPA